MGKPWDKTSLFELGALDPILPLPQRPRAKSMKNLKKSVVSFQVCFKSSAFDKRLFM